MYPSCLTKFKNGGGGARAPPCPMVPAPLYNVCMYVCLHVSMYVCKCVCVCVCLFVYVYVWMYTCLGMYVCMYAYVCVYKLLVYNRDPGNNPGSLVCSIHY